MSAIPRKKRRGRPRGSKNKPKPVVVQAAELESPVVATDDYETHARLHNEIASLSPERSYVAGYFGLEKFAADLPDENYQEIPVEVVGPIVIRTNPHDGSVTAIREETGEPIEMDKPFIVCPLSHEDRLQVIKASNEKLKTMEEQARATICATLNSEMYQNATYETPAFTKEAELKFVLSQIDGLVKTASAYSMDSGARGVMNEIELLMAKNRGKFAQ